MGRKSMRVTFSYCLGYKNRTIRGTKLETTTFGSKKRRIHALKKRVGNYVVRSRESIRDNATEMYLTSQTRLVRIQTYSTQHTLSSYVALFISVFAKETFSRSFDRSRLAFSSASIHSGPVR